MAKKTTQPALTRAEREKLKDTPYSTIAELEAAEKKIMAHAWEKVEKARRLGALLDKPKYKYVFDRLQKGIACNYGKDGDMIRVYADHESGLIRVDIAEGIEQTNLNAEMITALISSLSKTVQTTYYAATGLPMVDTDINQKDDMLDHLLSGKS